MSDDPTVIEFYVGQSLPIVPFILEEPDGSVSNLTGATLAMTITDMRSQVVTTGVGQWEIINAMGGLASYEFAAADTAAAGFFALIVVATFVGGGEEIWPAFKLRVRSFADPF